MVRIELNINKIKEYIDSIIKKEKEHNAKEKTLEALREGIKLSWRKLRFSVDEDARILVKNITIFDVARCYTLQSS